MDCTTAAIVFIKSVDSYRPLPAKRACPFIRAGMFDHGTASEKAFRPSFALGLVVFQPFGQLFRHGRILRLSASFLPCKIIAHIVLVAGRLSPSFLEGRHLSRYPHTQANICFSPSPRSSSFLWQLGQRALVICSVLLR